MIRPKALSLLFLLAPLAAHAGVPDGAAWSNDPRGEGDPAAITCRVPQQLPGLRQRGRVACHSNRVWAALHARRYELLPDGKTLVKTGLSSEACGSERVAGVTAMLDTGAARTFYRCNY